VSSNIPTKSDGLPYAESKLIDDPGIAAYFDFQGKSLVWRAMVSCRRPATRQAVSG
jgi:hypothetical protein